MHAARDVKGETSECQTLKDIQGIKILLPQMTIKVDTPERMIKRTYIGLY